MVQPCMFRRPFYRRKKLPGSDIRIETMKQGTHKIP
jgi:hypothetical protein